MGRGGARNRSGPQPDPSSGRSDRRGLAFGSLPVGGFVGVVPAFPLPEASERELEVWGSAWRSPQADAWSREVWRHRTVALWVRYSVRMEALDASAALGNVVQRLADQIGMTPAGLRENGWTISPADAPVVASESKAKGPVVSARRLRAVAGDGGQ